jgi:hypothetical protein
MAVTSWQYQLLCPSVVQPASALTTAAKSAAEMMEYFMFRSI